jgi:hypothetical protein
VNKLSDQSVNIDDMYPTASRTPLGERTKKKVPDFSRTFLFQWSQQDSKRLGTIILKQYKCQKALFFNGFCQFEKIWKNHKKRQLHSQLHSNCIQRMAVLTLQRTTTCSSSMTVLFYFFAHDGCFIGLRSGYDCARNACTEGCPKTPVYKAFPGLYPGTTVPCLGGTFLLLYPGTYPLRTLFVPGYF